MSVRPALFLLMAMLASWARPAIAAESYDNCTGFINAVPATISTQGVWCLRSNLSTAMAAGAAITITGNNVTIDCNEFKIGGLAAGPTTAAKGIEAWSQQNITVRRCGIRGFSDGIFIIDGAGHLVEDNRLDNNIGVGIRIQGDASLVQRNRIYDMGGAGAQSWAIAADGDILDNIIDGATSSAVDYSPTGIYSSGSGSLIRGNRIKGMVGNGTGVIIGIRADGGAVRIQDNHLSAPSPGNNVGIGGTASVCVGNSVLVFNTPLTGCALGGDNYTL